MSTSIVHVLTIIGKGAEQTEAACEELLARRVERKPGQYGTEDWSERDHIAIRELCAALIGHSRRLPVLYYAQYLDSWSIGTCFHLLTWPDANKRRIDGVDHSLVFHPSQFREQLQAQIDDRRRTLKPHDREVRWFLDHFRDALDSAIWLDSKYLVVCISEAIGGSRQDDEIKAALELPIELPKTKSVL